MFALAPSFDKTSEIFIEDIDDVIQALSDIHGSLTLPLIREVMIATNSKTQHLSDYAPRNSIIPSWQFNITNYLREKLVALDWRTIDGSGGVAYILSPCKHHAIRVFSGNKYVGMREEGASNNTSKGKTLNNDIYSPELSFENDTKIWILLFFKEDEVIRCELSQPKVFKNGKVVEWNKRIKLPNIKFNIPNEPLQKVEKVEVGSVPVRRKKSG